MKRLEFLCLSGFVQGLDGEVPVAVDFHCDYQNGALLVTVSWKSLIKIESESRVHISKNS